MRYSTTVSTTLIRMACDVRLPRMKAPAQLCRAADPLPDAPLDNNLLRALRPEDQALVRPDLHCMRAEAGTILYEPGDDVRFVYFPRDATLVSFVVPLEDGRAVETALIGREGAVGGIVSQGRLPAYARAVVQFDGEMYRMETAQLDRAKSRSHALRHLFARYADCVVAQIFQSVACNATHSIEQRTAKWLLAAIERTGQHEVPLTQERLSAMLGIGRSYVSRVIRSLKQDGVLATRRGVLTVESTAALQEMACGCNDAVRRHFDDVLKGVYPAEPTDGPQCGPREPVGTGSRTMR